MSDFNFIDECKEWLWPKGYYVHSYSGDKLSVNLMNENNILPMITCSNRSWEKTCKLSDCSYKLFLTLQSGELMFRHPDIEKYIQTFAHYTALAQDFPPPNFLR